MPQTWSLLTGYPMVTSYRIPPTTPGWCPYPGRRDRELSLAQPAYAVCRARPGEPGVHGQAHSRYMGPPKLALQVCGGAGPRSRLGARSRTTRTCSCFAGCRTIESGDQPDRPQPSGHLPRVRCEDCMDQTADYVVAGAGSAGCVLAKRLAESGASVILLEAGGPDLTRLVRKPGMIAIFHNVPALKKRLDWGYYTAPQATALGRKIPQPRGRVLGGSGSINGMLFVRGTRKNYDDWAAAGCAGWSYSDVLRSFQRMENWEDGATALRGSGGPIQVSRQKDLTQASQAFIEI